MVKRSGLQPCLCRGCSVKSTAISHKRRYSQSHSSLIFPATTAPRRAVLGMETRWHSWVSRSRYVFSKGCSRFSYGHRRAAAGDHQVLLCYHQLPSWRRKCFIVTEREKRCPQYSYWPTCGCVATVRRTAHHRARGVGTQ